MVSEACEVNSLLAEHCRKNGWLFIDNWARFFGKDHLYARDGVHLSHRGVGPWATYVGLRRHLEGINRDKMESEIRSVVGTEECLISGIPFALHIKNMRIFTIVPTATSAHYGTLHPCLVTTT
ncbi:hypothetical protein GWK47_014043 [Chionoecetes opilio]|uniref:SGNH hydrolase-type esterase domain-containing protein n=1 Tax=Chionoecetes opilio TaxID=41210 RepID=A0A8J5CKP1_CHIOP|nr:hypothetical protein GWK47_014043 [Chionoecetes opilio]